MNSLSQLVAIGMHRKRVNISTVLAGQRLGIKEVEDGIGSSASCIEEWERDHGAAAKGKPPPPGFGPVRKDDDDPQPESVIRVL